jgi:ectoine hydroxylase-related dioxygenase (phytanoyl-CoA dioxygenase family)
MNDLTLEFNQKGFVFIKNFFSQDEINALIAEIQATSSEHVSKDKLNLGSLTFNSLIMHKSQKLREFISQPKVVNFLSQFIGPNFWVRWDQAVEKGPGAGTFPWHQDNSYSQLKDPHYQLWISLTKMTKENGGIWMIPGSHKQKITHSKDGCHTVAEANQELAEFISAEIGDIVLFSSYALHSTTPNVTDESRWAYVVEYMKLEHIDPYIDAPHLIIAQNGVPAMHYVNHLASEDYLMNKIKYFDLKKTLRKIKRTYFPFAKRIAT